MLIEKLPNGDYKCGESGISVRVTDNRNITRFTFIREDVRMFDYIAEVGSRPASRDELEKFLDKKCPKVVIWKMLNGIVGPDIFPGVLDPNLFIEDFLRWFQHSDGWGCIINGERQQAIVEIVR